MNQQIQTISELDRVIHEPGRLMIVTLLFAVEKTDFLYLLHETGMNKGTLSSHISRLEKEGYVDVVSDQQPYLQGFLPVVQVCLTKKYGFAGLHIDTGTGIVTKEQIDYIENLVNQGYR